MKLMYEEEATQSLMTWFEEKENKKWQHKIRKISKRYKANVTDDFETEFIDIDSLLDLYIEEYQTKKKLNLKNFQNEFVRLSADRKEGNFSTDEIEKIVLSLLPSISNSAFVKFPGHFTIRRAFLYALICKENNYFVNLVEFLCGCNRFGLDSPAPTINKKVGFYGNDEDFETILKKDLENYNITQQLQMHTIKTRHNPISIEPARLKSSDSLDNVVDNALSKTSPTRFAPKSFMNMKLLGKAQ